VKCKITERPKRITVERNGKTHTARWRQQGGNDGELFEVEGDHGLLRAVFTAWDGPNEFELTDQKADERGGGWWSAG